MKTLSQCALTLGLALVAAPAALGASDKVPANVGFGLQQIVEAAGGSAESPFMRFAARDAAARVQVDVLLDGHRSMPEMLAALQAAGATIIDSEPGYRHGIVAAMAPTSRIAAMATMRGVRSIMMSGQPRRDVGAATSQGVATIRASDVIAQGDRGTGVTVGIMSDSFNSSGDAPKDVRAGDLPGPGNPRGNPQPVVVLDDLKPGSDEGRAMMQIVADVAPGARLCFATSFSSAITFARNIRALADPAKGCGAQVIVDDTYYTDEPVYSDGVISQAVNQVAARGVTFLTSAGNFNPFGFEDTLRLVTDAQGRQKRSDDPVDVSSVPADLTAGGFHNFRKDGGVQISLPFSQFNDALIVLQWNDPFDAAAITTDLNILVFDAQGKYLPDASGIDDNSKTGRPIEAAALNLRTGNPNPQYRVVIARRTTATTAQPVVFRLLDVDRAARPASFLNRSETTAFGHKATTGAIAVAADYFGRTDTTEVYSSNGPGRLDFDSAGRRLARPLILQRPDIAAPDGVATTVAGFASFFGTSAAAPHAAGVAALLLAAKGGPGTLTPERIRTVLRATAGPHNLTTAQAEAFGSTPSASLRVTASGVYADSARQFTVDLTAPNGVSVQSLTVDLGRAGLQWFPPGAFPIQAAIGFPASAAHLRPDGYPRPDATFLFAPGAFVSGTKFQFGFPFAVPMLQGQTTGLANTPGGPLISGSPGLLAGAIVRAVLSNGQNVTATFALPQGRAWTPETGAGLIDALAAYRAVRGGAVEAANAP